MYNGHCTMGSGQSQYQHNPICNSNIPQLTEFQFLYSRINNSTTSNRKSICLQQASLLDCVMWPKMSMKSWNVYGNSYKQFFIRCLFPFHNILLLTNFLKYSNIFYRFLCKIAYFVYFVCL